MKYRHAAYTLPLLTVLSLSINGAQAANYPLVDTMQDQCFDVAGNAIGCPASGAALYGQDAQHKHLPASYTNLNNGTVKDNNTQLIWQKMPINQRLQFAEAKTYCGSLNLGGLSNWRVPTITQARARQTDTIH